MIKIVSCLLALFFAILAGPVHADAISLKRGLPTDIWITWPDGERFSEPALIATFPEYRQVFKGHEFKLAKSAGFDFIRLTVDPAIFLWKPTPDKTRTLLAGVRAAIDEIRSNDLNVVVDLHSIPRAAGMGTRQVLASGTAFDDYLRVVNDVGTLVARYPPDAVAFEPFNEPTIDCAWDKPRGAKPRWPALLRKLHDTARAAAPDTTIILSGACWGGAEGLVQLNPNRIRDKNVLWSFHAYEPFLFTHQGAGWTDDHYKFVEGLAFPPSPSDKSNRLKIARSRLEKSDADKKEKSAGRAALKRDFDDYFKPGFAIRKAREPFNLVARWAKKYAIPRHQILLGEFGTIRADLSRPLTDQERVAFIRLIRTEAERRGFAWSTWSWTGSFGISEPPEGRQFSPLILQALGMK